MAAHARLMTASGADRWTVCPASAVVSANLPRTSNLAAAKGTLKHELCHRAKTSGVGLAEFLGTTFVVEGFTIEVDQEFLDHCQYALDYLDTIVLPGDVVMWEHRMDFSPITGEEGAVCTADVIIIRENPTQLGNTLIVVDLKFGQMKVFADKWQLAAYLITARHQLAFAGDYVAFEAHICQPPIDHIHVVEVTTKELDATEDNLRWFAKRVLEAEQNLQDKHFNPTEDACRYCPAAGNCKALAQRMIDLMTDDATDMSQPIDIQDWEMDAQTLANVMSAIPMVKNWVSAIEERAFNDLSNGVEVPGFKLVAGRKGIRAWDKSALDTVTQRLESVLGDNAWEKKLVSPTTVEKILKKDPEWDQFQDFITQPEGKPTVVPSSDKRPALAGVQFHDDI